jgi:hypothetical protein
MDDYFFNYMNQINILFLSFIIYHLSFITTNRNRREIISISKENSFNSIPIISPEFQAEFEKSFNIENHNDGNENLSITFIIQPNEQDRFIKGIS